MTEDRATPFLTDSDLYLFGEGTFHRAWEKMGAHVAERDGARGVYFAVWAPNANRVSVVGDFNGWRDGETRLRSRGSSGIWDGFVPGLERGTLYKYVIHSTVAGYKAEKADPYGLAAELRPKTASVVWDLEYDWDDADWMGQRGDSHRLDRPLSIYEVHLGSWMRVAQEGDRWLTYRELADRLTEYVAEMGFTHVELLPVSEHPFDGSWGYQTIGYFAPTSRFGTPQDFMYLVDRLHQAGIGVILDWVPAHFPRDAHGLGFFDGTHLYEHADPRKGAHQDWGTLVFNYGRNEVVNFLLSNALFWLEEYHIDGLRVDAVASMLYLDYSRNEGEWVPNEFGGRENLEAVHFIKRFNELVYQYHPDAMTIAEESTAWPMVSRPTYLGGLGFGLKWNMGWMNDTLTYMGREPVYRKHHQNDLTFSIIYAFSENFVLPFSHDEVVHGKGSMMTRMPGDPWQKLANLRLLYGYTFTHPGKTLLFMGTELGQWQEWSEERSVDWHLLEDPGHRGLQRWVRDLNTFVRGTPALYELDFDAAGFRWVDCHDHENSVLAFLRLGRDASDAVLVVCNFTPVPRQNYRIGVPSPGFWREALNSDAELYGGSGQGNLGGRPTAPVSAHGFEQSIAITLPPLGVVVFAPGVSGA